MALLRSRKTVLWDRPVGGSMVDPDTFGGHCGISTQTFYCSLEPYLPLGPWKSGL